MKKGLLKVLLPITALLLSGCDFLSWMQDNLSGGETETVEKEDTEKKDGSETEEKPETEGESQEQTPPEVDPPVDEDPPEEDPPVESPFKGYPTSIELPDNIPLTIGQTKSLSVTYSPVDTEHKEVEWSTSNELIATVENGEVTGHSAGKVKITARTFNTEGETITSECNFVVTNPEEIEKTKLLYTYDDYVANNAYSMSNCPLIGNSKLLIIPIWFSDSDTFIKPGSREKVRSDIQTAYFGTNEETGWRSVSSFYEEESKGILSMVGTVAGWYEIEETYDEYLSESTGYGLTKTLIGKATDDYFSEHSSESRQDYDTNGDGYLDAVILVYGAPDYASLGQYSGNLWAYTSWLETSPNYTNPSTNVFFWASYDFMYSYGDKAFSRTGRSKYGHGDTNHCNIDAHTFIHEMGHVLGLPDYYDYSGQHSPAGGFSMQDLNVGGHDAHSVMAYGWADPYIPTKNTTITINDFQSSHDMILLANHEVTSPFDEYMLLELYSPTGLNKGDSDHAYQGYYPQGPKTVGIRLWHVDARLTYWNYYSGWSKTLISDPTRGDVYMAMTNTYYRSGMDTSSFPLGVSYANYNILELIGNNGVKEELTADALFTLGSSFKLTKENTQFMNPGKMNGGSYLGWSFSVDAIDETSAAITVKKV